ncbi:MAG: WecB/TagA/CpsF family glycosyltransferase [Candidatus Aminicenantes bacterium]|nr:WecB/TagA/CpsF family glycosyltransferase [Candidatus Aminicenantes bacterium]
MTASTTILGMPVSKLTSRELVNLIQVAIDSGNTLKIAYANAHTLNMAYQDGVLGRIFHAFDLIHPDGIGVYWASRIMDRNDALPERMTGSDFYRLLVEYSLKNNWRLFFFGHSPEILGRLKDNSPGLNIVGLQEGYHFRDDEVIAAINRAHPDVLIVGLSCPKQEKWIHAHGDRLNTKVILAVGDGIRVFSGDKLRGPRILQRLGLEWFIRFLSNPVKHFRRYVIGNPLFILRVLNAKRSGVRRKAPYQ